jgi:hypothetical protein
VNHSETVNSEQWTDPSEEVNKWTGNREQGTGNREQ